MTEAFSSANQTPKLYQIEADFLHGERGRPPVCIGEGGGGGMDICLENDIRKGASTNG